MPIRDGVYYHPLTEEENKIRAESKARAIEKLKEQNDESNDEVTK